MMMTPNTDQNTAQVRWQLLKCDRRLTCCVVPSTEDSVAKDVGDGCKSEDGQEDQVGAPLGHDKLVIGGHDSSGTDELGYHKLA